MCKCVEINDDGQSVNLPIFECEAIKLHSSEWALTRVNNCEEDFNMFEIFCEGDYIDENSYTPELENIKANYIKFKVKVVDLDFKELVVFDIQELVMVVNR